MKREFGTQMAKPGVYIDDRNDKIVTSKSYFDSVQWTEKRYKTTLYIQCCVRGWFARKKAKSLRENKQFKEQELLYKEAQFRQEEEKKHRAEIERRMQPRTFKDFEILYNELEVWRQNETSKIKENPKWTEEEKRKALQQLLLKETKLLQTIDKLKIQANDSNRDERIKRFLNATSAPKMWERSDGRFTEVDTPFSTRAKELQDL